MATFLVNSGLKSLFLSLLFGLLLVGCGSDYRVNDGNGNGGNLANVEDGDNTKNPGDIEDIEDPEDNWDTGYKISFFDSNLNLIDSVSELNNNVNITAIAEELGITGAMYTASGTSSVIGNPYYEEYNLDQDTRFYSIAGIKEISNQAELNNIRNALSGKYILVDDIDLDNAGSGFSATGWTSIGGSASAKQFKGIFNGNGHAIRGIWVNVSSNYVGLFGYVSGATIKNLIVEVADGSAIKGAQYVGGIVGFATEGSFVKNTCVKGAVKGSSTGVGGIVGHLRGSYIVNSCYEGSINGNGYVGGVAGHVREGSLIKNSYSIGAVISTGANAGGIAGYVAQDDTSVINSYSTATVSGTTYIGGIVGRVYGLHSSIIQNNAAINPSVTGSGTTYRNRVLSDDGAYIGNIANNYALATMGGTFTQSDTARHGISKNANELKSQIAYEDGLFWNFGNDDDNPWVLGAYGNYPYPTLYWETN
jgi:hypothetical protein